MGSTHTIGIVGVGVISSAYLETLSHSRTVRVAAVADLDESRAVSVADRIPGCRVLTPTELVADADVETVLNLTIPAAHAEVALAAIGNGKDVFGEKPLAATLDEAFALMDAAASAGRHVGCAPDTVLGTGVQTARDAIDRGLIGEPVSAAATWISAGHEAWHPHPDFYYRVGGGPLLDMGPYYITSLVHLLGPVLAVSGASSRARTERVIGSGPRRGERIGVEVDTHLTGILQHASGAISSVTVSFDGIASTASPIEVHGVDGSLIVPDPNQFAGQVRLHTREATWADVAATAGFADAGRGIGLIDFLSGQRRASGEMALHCLEIMTLLQRSAESGVRESLTTSVERPSLVPLTEAAAWRQL